MFIFQNIESLKTVGEPPYVIKLLEGTQGEVVLTETMEAAISAMRL